ncbi:MAG: hypothetical protein LCH37_03960 [Bacteroidetes bacterium]|nr:hypothetical protein [Bacteroidota bacterium]
MKAIILLLATLVSLSGLANSPKTIVLKPIKVALPGTPYALKLNGAGMAIKCLPPFDRDCILVIMKTGFDVPSMLISREVPMSQLEQQLLDPEKNYIIENNNTYIEVPNLTITNFENHILVSY